MLSSNNALGMEFWSSSGRDFSWQGPIRGGIETFQFQSFLELLSSMELGSQPDRWNWELDNSGIFSVSSIRRYIDDFRLLVGGIVTRWNKFVPIKVNVLM